jgi:hypothetical protein
MIIPINKLPEISEMLVRRAIAWNLSPTVPGTGNRARRRAGVPAPDATQTHSHGMNASEKATWPKHTNP